MSAYKDIAKLAKVRISRNAGDEGAWIMGLVSGPLYLGGRMLNKEEADCYISKIADVIRNNNENFALGYIMEDWAKNCPDSPEKERYVLELSRFYCKLKDVIKDAVIGVNR